MTKVQVQFQQLVVLRTDRQTNGQTDRHIKVDGRALSRNSQEMKKTSTKVNFFD